MLKRLKVIGLWALVIVEMCSELILLDIVHWIFSGRFFFNELSELAVDKSEELM